MAKRQPPPDDRRRRRGKAPGAPRGIPVAVRRRQAQAKAKKAHALRSRHGWSGSEIARRHPELGTVQTVCHYLRHDPARYDHGRDDPAWLDARPERRRARHARNRAMVRLAERVQAAMATEPERNWKIPALRQRLTPRDRRLPREKLRWAMQADRQDLRATAERGGRIMARPPRDPSDTRADQQARRARHAAQLAYARQAHRLARGRDDGPSALLRDHPELGPIHKLRRALSQPLGYWAAPAQGKTRQRLRNQNTDSGRLRAKQNANRELAAASRDLARRGLRTREIWQRLRPDLTYTAFKQRLHSAGVRLERLRARRKQDRAVRLARQGCRTWAAISRRDPSLGEGSAIARRWRRYRNDRPRELSDGPKGDPRKDRP